MGTGPGRSAPGRRRQPPAAAPTKMMNTRRRQLQRRASLEGSTSCDGPEESLSQYTLLCVLRHLGVTMTLKQEAGLMEQFTKLAYRTGDRLGFVGFLKMVRWLL